MPVPVARPPTQATDVPVKVNVACAPAVAVAAAPPALQLRAGAALQLASKLTDASVSSKRCACGGGAFVTVTVTGAEVRLLPASSRATAVSVCDPSLAPAVFHDTAYGPVMSSAPRLAPSSLNCTPTRPTLSEAVALTLTVPARIAPATGALMLTLGGELSTSTVTAAELRVLPAASRATAVSVCEPLLAPAGFPDTG